LNLVLLRRFFERGLALRGREEIRELAPDHGKILPSADFFPGRQQDHWIDAVERFLWRRGLRARGTGDEEHGEDEAEHGHD
jgi:hypothetical protein